MIRAYRWHRPLMLLVAGSLVLLVVSTAGLVFDDRTLTGAPIWLKPLKFAVSTAVYAFSLAWLISLLSRRRLASILGTVIAVTMTGELIAITGQVVRGHTSHFDVATPFDTAVWGAMAVMIATLWVSNLILVVLLLRQRFADAVLTWALRLGLAISVVGMALAYLMTFPTAAQTQSWANGAKVTVVGAHSVGLADGGPGLAVTEWSTKGGDLRIPHFVGLHGLQVMILLALGLSILARRNARFRSDTLRLQIVVITAVSYFGLIAILTWQALRGWSVVHPDTATVLATVVLAALSLAAYATAFIRSRPAASV